MENRRRRSQLLAILLVLIGTVLFAGICLALVYIENLSAEAKTALVQWGTAILTGTILSAAAYEWSSSKGSAMKDELMASKPSPATAQSSAAATVEVTTEGAKT